MHRTDLITDSSAKALQIKEADRCVMCGLCLPHCPTYNLFQQEGDSPRGRISLMKALANDDIAPDEKLIEHLEGCLLCRHCETVCPAQVPFGRLLDQARRELFVQSAEKSTTQAKFSAQSPTQLPVWLNGFARMRILRRCGVALLQIYRRSGLRTLLQKTHVLKLFGLEKFDMMLPRCMPRFTYRNQAKTGKQTVALFTGCVGEILDSETLNATKQLLNIVGFKVVVPKKQNCCGAMHQHAGDWQSAETLLAQNAIAFQNTPEVISCAGGCGVQLAEHAERLNIRHYDVSCFLSHYRKALNFRKCTDTVTLHTPCTMQSDEVEKLLSLVPGLNIRPLTKQAACCGAAGAYMLMHPATAQALLEPLLDVLAQQKSRILLTSNIGCALHFRRGLAQRQMAVEVMHPISWLKKNLVK